MNSMSAMRHILVEITNNISKVRYELSIHENLYKIKVRH